MKLLAGAVAGALLVAGALPAVAGGYWDAQDPLPPPPPQYAEGPPPCHQGCGPPPPCGCWQDRRGYHGQALREQPLPPPPPPESVVLPAEFFADGESSVGPAFLEDEGSSGGAVEAADFGNAEASAFASASAHVSVNVRVMQHIMQRNHMMMGRHMQMHHSCGCSGHHW